MTFNYLTWMFNKEFMFFRQTLLLFGVLKGKINQKSKSDGQLISWFTNSNFIYIYIYMWGWKYCRKWVISHWRVKVVTEAFWV